MSIIVNKPAIRRTLEAWFIAARAGETLGAHETAKLSSADAAAQSSDYFFDKLSGDEDVMQHDPDDSIREWLNANPVLWTGLEGTPREILGQIVLKLQAEKPADTGAFFG